jgi:hypothetical protein
MRIGFFCSLIRRMHLMNRTGRPCYGPSVTSGRQEHDLHLIATDIAQHSCSEATTGPPNFFAVKKACPREILFPCLRMVQASCQHSSASVEFLNLFKPSTFFGGVQFEQFCQRITNLNNSIVNLNFVKRVSCSQLFRPLLAISAQLTVPVVVTCLLGPASVVMVDFTIFDPNAGKTVRTPGEPSFLHFSFNTLLDSTGVTPARIPTEGSEDITKAPVGKAMSVFPMITSRGF